VLVPEQVPEPLQVFGFCWVEPEQVCPAQGVPIG
jgi:hypothetical protein